MDFEAPTAPRALLTSVMSTQPDVASYAGGDYGQASVNGQEVPAIGVDPIRGGGFLTVLSGRLPAGPGEIALGQRTLRTAGGRIGVRVRVDVNGREHQMRIVGEVIFASFTEGGFSATDLGEGAAMAPSVLSTPFPHTGCTGGLTCYSFILLRYRPGVRLRDADAYLQATLAKRGCTLAAGCYSLVTDQRPSDIRDYTGVRDTPLILGALLALLAVGTLSHVLLTGVRRRRRDLAVLKILGLLRSQMLRVVSWEASALAAVALLAGVPLGVLAGRGAWALFAASSGVAGHADVPMPIVVAAIPVTVLLANVIAAGPGWAAARVRPAAILRNE